MLSSNLTLREISDIVIATFRAHRRHNERLIGSMEMADRIFTSLRRNGVEMNDQQWAATDKAADCAGGQNLTFANIRAYSNVFAANEGISAEQNDALNEGFYGYIWIYSDAIVELVSELRHVDASFLAQACPKLAQYGRLSDESEARYAQRLTLFILSHERRHSCQDPEVLMAEYARVTLDNLAAVHDDLPCEIDANEFGTYQTLGEYGMYREAF